MKRALLVLTLLLCTGRLGAQVDRATLSGTVRDESGGVLSAATVAVTHVATQVTARARANSGGAFHVPNLIPGHYLVEVEATGFTKKADAIILEVGQRAQLDVTLGVGGLAETVTVEDARHLLNTSQSALGTVIDQNAVGKLPLAIRNWDDLLALVPGVQGDRFTEEGGGTSFGRSGGVNVHGSRSLQNNFLLDGVDNNSISTNVQELTTQVSRPSIDAIQEFKVVTSPYSAEYGRSPGAAITVITKSGTNAFHGGAYDFYRNDRFDSNNYFAKAANAPKATNDQNQFGANLGGPIVKDKAFFFVDFEGTRITRGVTRLTRVPTANERNGIFTSAVRDPLTGQSFPNNTIPQNRIDPVAAAILALVPLPNQAGANNFFRQPETTDNANRLLGRVDVKLSDSDNVFGRYIWSDRERFVPGAFGGLIDGTGTSAFGRQDMVSHGLVLGWTRVISSTVVNEFRYSYVRANSVAEQDPFGEFPPSAAQVPRTPDSPIVAGGFPGFTIDGFFEGPGLGRIGSPDFLPKFQRTRQMEFINTLSWLRGSHQMKFGFDILAPMKNEYLDVPAVRGSLRFRNRFTGNPLGDFLLGYVSDAQVSNTYVADQRHWAASFFVHDDWRVGTKLTINAGVRYDFITPALEGQNRQSNFLPAGGGSLIFASDGSLQDRGLVKPDRNNIAPRVGFVYKLDEKTVVRGGYGLFYNLFDRIGSEDQLALNPPGLNNVAAVSSNTVPVFFVRNGFPLSFFSPINLDPASGGLRALRIRAVSEDAPKAMTHQMSFGGQRELAAGFVVSVDGVLSYGRNLANLVNLNQPPGGAGALPYPNFGFIEWREHKGSSSYKGVDVSLDKRFAKGVSFGVAYTLSESRDDSSEHLSTQGSASFPQDARNLDAWEGPSDYDVRHRLAVNFVAELPFGKDKRWASSGPAAMILGGWGLSGVFAGRSGRPFMVTQSGNNVGTNMTGLPNQISEDTDGPQTIQQWFNTAAFQAVPSGTFGNVKRNGLRGPGYQTLDLSLSRRLKTSRGAATLRWDVFNVFDHVNFGIPNRNLSTAATFGTISTLAGDPRIMQFSVRLEF